jgi:hypothetical protein
MTIPIAAFDARCRRTLLIAEARGFEAVKLARRARNQRAAILGGGVLGGSAVRDSVGAMTAETIPENLGEMR